MTVWPALTSTAVTRPATAKERLAWLAGSMVPLADTAWVIVPVVTVWTLVVVVIHGEALNCCTPSQVPTPAAAKSTTRAAMIVHFLVYHLLRSGPTCPHFCCPTGSGPCPRRRQR